MPRPAPHSPADPPSDPPGLDAAPLPALAVDQATGRIVSANARADGLPRDLIAFVAGTTGETLADAFAAGGPPAGTEFCCDTAAGRRAFLVYRSPAGPGVEALGLAEVTELRASETALRRELASRDEFVTVAAHELKDPLVALQLALRLSLEMAADDAPASEIIEYLEISRRQSERLGSLMENLLDLSRIAGGRVRIDREAVDLAALAWEVTARLRETARFADCRLAVEAAAPVIGYFDRIKIEQVLGNLVSNAIKYGAGRPVSVRVAATDGWGLLEVEDDGRGIQAEDRERIFGRFERAAADHARESLGLGLYIVRTYVEAHGGTVSVRGEPGRGSTFVVRLPLRRLPGGEGRPRPETNRIEGTAP